MTHGQLVHASIFPHPPIMVPEVGSAPSDLEKCRPSREAAQRLAGEIAALSPQAVVLITPHGPLHPRAMGILARPRLQGDLGYFRAPQVAYQPEGDPPLARAILEAAKGANVPLLELDEYQPMRLDHGVVVPWYFLAGAGVTATLVPLTYSYLSNGVHLQYGQAVARAIGASGKRVAVVASGDLSHRLLPTAPAGYNPRGQEFDRLVVDAVGKGDWGAIDGIDPELMEAAGECGYRSMLILAGILAGTTYQPKVYAYDAPYGVGYLVASFPPTEPTGQVNPAGEVLGAELTLDEPAGLARRAVESWIAQGRRLQPPRNLPPAWQQQAGVFVTIKHGQELRGCIGTYRPTHGDLCREILHNAVLAATEDPRFPPVAADELPLLNYHVNVLAPIEPVAGPEDLDPLRYGVVVRAGSHQGLLLPNLPQIRSVTEQISVARSKAGIAPAEPVELFRFTSREYGEGESLAE